MSTKRKFGSDEVSTIGNVAMWCGDVTPVADVDFTTDTYTFAGAKPSEISYLSGTSSNIQEQLDAKQDVSDTLTAILDKNWTSDNLTNLTSWAEVTTDSYYTKSAIDDKQYLSLTDPTALQELDTAVDNYLETAGYAKTTEISETYLSKTDASTEYIATGKDSVLTSNITLSGEDENQTPYTFCGAAPSEIGHLTGVTSAIQPQLDTVVPFGKHLGTPLSVTGQGSIQKNTPTAHAQISLTRGSSYMVFCSMSLYFSGPFNPLVTDVQLNFSADSNHMGYNIIHSSTERVLYGEAENRVTYTFMKLITTMDTVNWFLMVQANFDQTDYIRGESKVQVLPLHMASD